MEQLAKDLIKAVQSTQHVGEDSYLDSSLEEHLLAARYPEEYDRNVNGIRRIHVRDGSVDLRYIYKDGVLTQLKEGIF